MTVPRGRGRPAFVPTEEQRQQVAAMAANGDSQRIIARKVGINERTLRRAFKYELADGHAQIVAAIGSSVVRAALAGNMVAAKFWLATHGGPEWRETEHRTIEGRIDYSTTSTEDLERRRAELERLRIAGDQARDLEEALPKAVH